MNHVVIGFDFGMRRIGVAAGQSITKTASPLAPLKAHAGIPNWDEIAKLIKIWDPTALLVGIPVNLDDSEQMITYAAREFAKHLSEKTGLPVHNVDERLTTKDARERLFSAGGYKMLQNRSIDSMAAKIIVETWFTDLQTF